MWYPMMIKWCTNLRLASARGYDILRNVLKLPHDTTLKRYIHWTKANSGLSADALHQMLREIKYDTLQPHQKFIVIVHDEMKVESNLVYNKSDGRLIGFT